MLNTSGTQKQINSKNFNDTNISDRAFSKLEIQSDTSGLYLGNKFGADTCTTFYQIKNLRNQMNSVKRTQRPQLMNNPIKVSRDVLGYLNP